MTGADREKLWFMGLNVLGFLLASQASLSQNLDKIRCPCSIGSPPAIFRACVTMTQKHTCWIKFSTLPTNLDTFQAQFSLM